MTEIDLSFRRYVAKRKSIEAARAREGEAYAFGGDLRVRRALGSMRPVTLALEATVRLWRGVARSELLGTAVKVTDKQFPGLHAVVVRAAERLKIPVPTVYVSPKLGGLPAQTLGTSDEALVVISTHAAEQLGETELLFLLEHEYGRLQNDHVIYATAQFYLTHAAQSFVRWVVKPAAIALRAWARRGEITCDRAGLICVGDLAAAERALVKLNVGPGKLAEGLDVDEYLKQIDEQKASVGRMTELLAEQPYLPKRIAALRTFAETSYFRGLRGEVGGLSNTACDTQVSSLLGILR